MINVCALYGKCSLAARAASGSFFLPASKKENLLQKLQVCMAALAWLASSAHTQGLDHGSLQPMDSESHARQSQELQDNAVMVARAFEDQGLLLHTSFFGVDQLIKNKMNGLSLDHLTESQDRQYFKVEEDCGKGCSAWSLVHSDLPFAFYKPGEGVSAGFIVAPRSVMKHVVSMTPVDSDTVWRSCFKLANLAARKMCKECSDNPVSQAESDLRDATDSRAARWAVPTRTHQYACANLKSIETLDSYTTFLGSDQDYGNMDQKLAAGAKAPPPLPGQNRGPLSRFCKDHCFDRNTAESSSGKAAQSSSGNRESACDVCHGAAPYWCHASAVPNVTSAQDWMRLFSQTDDVSASSCKFHATQWDTFTDTVKLLRNYNQLNNLTLGTAGLHTMSTWNEVNLNFDPHETRRLGVDEDVPMNEAEVQEADALHEDAIIGVFYMDVETMDAQSRKDHKEVARLLVRAYNRRHAKQINMFRIISQEDDKHWRYGSRAKFSDYMRVDSAYDPFF